MKLLVTGATGQLGRCLQDAVASNTQLQATFLSRKEADLSKPESLADLVEQHRPDWLINAAAYTAVDKAESEPELAMAINGVSPGVLATQCAQSGVSMLQVSTDYVFSGQGNQPYATDHAVSPLGQYGKSKAAGETAVRSACENHLMVRTSWVFSEYGNNFLKTMLRLAETRNELKVVNDQYGSPTYAGDLAQAILAMVQTNSPHFGTYHYTNSPVISWYDFACSIFEIALEMGAINHAIKVYPIPSEEFPTPAERPKWSALDFSSTEQDFGLKPVDYRVSTRQVIQRLINMQLREQNAT